MTKRSTFAASELAESDLVRIKSTLRTIIASGHLGQSDRRARLLDYLVDRECSGEGGRIKAFSIGVDVFDRDASFDPNTDSIVRTEMARLRDGLRLFYAENDSPDLVRIEIPKGSYRPRFRCAPSPSERVRSLWPIAATIAALATLALLGWTVLRPATGPSAAAPVDVVRISVLPFAAEGNHPDLDEIAFGLFSELTMDLSAYPWIAVVSPIPEGVDASERADFVLANSLLWKDERLLTNSQLQSAADGRLIWSKAQTVATDVAAIEDVQNQITSGIAASLGSVQGFSEDLVRLRNARNSEADLDAFLCFLGVYHYVAVPTDDEHRALRTCLERVTRDFPDYGEAWAALGFIYMDEGRFGRNPRPGADPWADARGAVERGLALAPLREPTLQAALILAIEAPERDLEAARTHAQKLYDLFPRHPATLVLIGSRLATFAGRWEEGLALVRQAQALEHDPPSVFFLTEAYFAAMGTDDAKLARATEPLTSRNSVPELLLTYLSTAATGRDEDAEALRLALGNAGFQSDDDLAGFVLNRRYDPTLEARLLERLGAASTTFR
ncbi:hypothetical protein [Sedimentitalea arenosa]|uniref:Adenylate cyclase n=1 Tax=Sedimentitalea arenosa TaxID=2798803 RepID=A0A8J7JG36_9RHOB|nr:hypothetical protein [Arenibacterium arenosum]MBJ6371104.1 hypothetical protein [Arenibacterium arenosum]